MGKDHRTKVQEKEIIAKEELALFSFLSSVHAKLPDNTDLFLTQSK